MSDPEGEAIGQGLVLADTLPLRWNATDPRALETEALRHHDNNEEVLRFISALEEYPGEMAEEHQPIAQEMARLEAKLNLLLGLMGQVLEVHFPLPPRHALRLNPLGIEWMADSGPQPGEFGAVEIFINSRCPRPLILAGQVEKAFAVEDGMCYVMRFTTMGDSIRERLEKIIFRHHRRSVALARRRTQGGGGKPP